jgi:hypothetical protein
LEIYWLQSRWLVAVEVEVVALLRRRVELVEHLAMVEQVALAQIMEWLEI